MAKGKQGRKRNNGIGCLVVIAIVAFAFVSAQRTPSRATPTPLPLRAESKTDTPGFTPEAGLAMTMEPEIYTTTGDGNLRSCASRDCDVVDEMIEGTAIRVTGVINGESVQVGNAIWYVVDHEGETAYLYSNLARPGAPATIKPGLQSTMPATAIIAPAQAQSPFGCNQQDDLNCTDFRAVGQNANAHLAQCGDEDRLDQDGDGRACELN